MILATRENRNGLCDSEFAIGIDPHGFFNPVFRCQIIGGGVYLVLAWLVEDDMALDKILIIAMIVIPLIFFGVRYGGDLIDNITGNTEQVGDAQEDNMGKGTGLK